MKENVVHLKENGDWTIPEEERLELRDDRKQWGDDYQKVREFCSNILVNPEGKLFETIRKNFLGRIQVGFEGELLAIKDESYTRYYQYSAKKQALVLVRKEEVEHSKKLPQLFGLRTRSFLAEMQEIAIADLKPTMKMTVTTQEKLKQAMQFIGHTWSVYDLQLALEALKIPTPFRIEWKEEGSFSIQDVEKESYFAELTFPTKETMQLVQGKQVVRWQMMKENTATYVKQVNV